MVWSLWNCNLFEENFARELLKNFYTKVNLGRLSDVAIC